MKPDSSGSVLRAMNILGVIAGALMIALPFLGPWWIARAGTGAMEVALSPFDMSITVLGQSISSDLIWLFLLAEKITIIIAGVFMILSSLLPTSWWSARLFKFGVMKPLWAIVGLIVLLIAGAFLMNNILPSFLSNMTGAAGASVHINVPYIMGTANSTIQVGSQATITAPIKLLLTPAFWVAVVTAALCIAARIYYRRFTKQMNSQ